MASTMNMDHANLTRTTHINGTLIRSDGLVCTFGATSWLDFCRMASQQAAGLWGRDGGIARVFGCEEGGDLAEFTLADCRRLAGAESRS